MLFLGGNRRISQECASERNSAVGLGDGIYLHGTREQRDGISLQYDGLSWIWKAVRKCTTLW